MLSVFEIAFQVAHFEIINVVVICIEMQWQKKKLILSDRVCMISHRYLKFLTVSPIYCASGHF